MPCACIKLCSGCHEYMPITEFYVINRKNGRRDILENHLACQCRTCEMQKFFRSDYRRLMVYRAKQNARAKNLEFNLTYEDIEIPTHCPVLGIELFTTPGRGKKNPWSYPNTPSIDRIDNSRGYVKDNIHIISMRANHLRTMPRWKNPRRLLPTWNGILASPSLSRPQKSAQTSTFIFLS